MPFPVVNCYLKIRCLNKILTSKDVNDINNNYVNSYLAGLFLSYFSSFEAGIANAISSSKWWKIFIFFENNASSKLNYLINWASTTNYILHFIDILFGLKSAWNRIYRGLAGQGLNVRLKYHLCIRDTWCNKLWISQELTNVTASTLSIWKSGRCISNWIVNENYKSKLKTTSLRHGIINKMRILCRKKSILFGTKVVPNPFVLYDYHITGI